MTTAAANPVYQLDWNLVRSFTAVARAGSLAGGARSLGLAHPTIARHIQQLESSIGIPLFDRTNAGLSLNGAGTRLAHVADNMRAGALAFENTTDQIRTGPAAPVRVATPSFMAQLITALLIPPDPLAPSGRDLPGLELVVAETPVNLLERDADLSLQHVEPTQQHLICRRLGNLTFGAFASADYLRQHGPPSATDLSDHTIVDGATDPSFSAALLRLGASITPAQTAFRSDAPIARLHAAATGWGIVALPCALPMALHGLRPVLPELKLPALPVWLLARPELRTTPALRAMFDALADTIQPRIAQSET